MTQVPLFVTKDMRQRLVDLGFGELQIDNMTPQEAWGHLGGMPEPPEPPEPGQGEDNTNPFLEAALFYAGLGWHVFPVVPKGKAPITPHGFKDATTDPTQIRQWWYYNPEANIGVNCGLSNLVVFDLDVKNGHDGPATWRDLCLEYGIEDSQALEQQTPTGGTHKIFAGSGVRNSTGAIAPGIDVRAEGGYILVPPSLTSDGQYTWEVSGHPQDREPGPLPGSLKALIDATKVRADVWEAAAKAGECQEQDLGPISQGQRNQTLTSLAGSMRRRGMSRDAIWAALLTENASRCVPPLPDDEVAAIADSVSRYTPTAPAAALPTTPAQPQNAYQAKTLLEKKLLWEPSDDNGHAQCLFFIHGAEYRYCDAYGWLYYNGKYWETESAEAKLDRAIVDMLIQRRALAVQAQREDIVKASRASAANVRNTKYLFQSLVAISVGLFDKSPDHINCQNGALDLRTGTLEPHRPEQFFTYCLPIEYDPQADYSWWENLVLQWVNGDRAILDYLQVAMGYSLTGHTWEECLFYLYGPTRSGKGTFTETILEMMGKKPLATEVDFATFTATRDNDSQNFDLAPLKPCRFIVASETNKYHSLNTAKVKALTGGNDVRCALKYKDLFTYRPQYKIWLSSNWPVNADVDDDAIWYRLQVIEFPNSYAGHEDKRLKEKAKSPENLKGVLAWATKGAIRWYNQGARGLQVPQKVKAATNKARNEIDYVAQWVEECVNITGNPQDFVANSALYLSYENWCKANGVEPKKIRSLTMELKRKGLDAGQRRFSAATGKVDRGTSGIQLT